MDHDQLSGIAKRWLSRPKSKNGAGCNLALVEVGAYGEIADAFGYRLNGMDGYSVVVEAKVTRSDFLADKKKPHRSGLKKGLGNYRYFICPEQLIQPDEVPDGWGLLWVNKRGFVRHKFGFISAGTEISSFYHECSQEGERSMMAHLLSRFDDIDEINQQHRQLYRTIQRLESKVKTVNDFKLAKFARINELEAEVLRLETLLKQKEADDASQSS